MLPSNLRLSLYRKLFHWLRNDLSIQTKYKIVFLHQKQIFLMPNIKILIKNLISGFSLKAFFSLLNN